MLDFLKRVDLHHIKDQVSDLRERVDSIQFRRPWTVKKSNTSIYLIAIGVGLAAISFFLYKKRAKILKYCGDCESDENTNKIGREKELGASTDE